MSANLPEEDLSCPVCCEIFQDPVLLPCSHSFCRSCLEHFWKSTVIRSCPVCRRRASKKSPASNRALKTCVKRFCWADPGQRIWIEHPVLETWRKAQTLLFGGPGANLRGVPSLKMHRGHDCSPMEEAALDCKVELTVPHCLDKLCYIVLLSATDLHRQGTRMLFIKFSLTWSQCSAKKMAGFQTTPPAFPSHCGICVLMYSGKMWSTHKSIKVYLRCWIWVTLQREVCAETERLHL